MGCLTLFALLAFLAFAFIGGAFWAARHVLHTYSSAKPAALPAIEPSAPAARGNETASTPLEASPGGTASAPVPVATPVDGAEVETRWKAFEGAARRGQKASIALSAAEINALISNDSDLRGKAFVTIQNNVGRVQISIPLKNVVFMHGRYLNGEATVEAAPDGDPWKAQITNITLAQQAVPDSMLDQRLFGWSSMRGMIQRWLDDENISVFKIENGQVIGESRGQ